MTDTLPGHAASPNGTQPATQPGTQPATQPGTQLGSPRWPWVAAVWLAVGLVDASQTVFPMRAQGMHHDWPVLFAVRVLDWLPWLLATPALLRAGQTWPVFGAPAPRNIGRHVLLFTAISVTAAAWSAALEFTFDPWAQGAAPAYGDLMRADLFYGALTALIVYAFIQIVVYAMAAAERAAGQRARSAELDAQLAHAQLAALRQQIDPHFLFNTLNAICGLVREQRNDSAVAMIAGLSDLLRRNAQELQRPQVTLAEELAALRGYLAIQQIRFADRLHVRIDIPPDLQETLVPSFLLQPLVENAIQHGIARRIEGGSIRIAGCRDGGVLRLSVHNDGPPLAQVPPRDGGGIGLANLRGRLRILYGERSGLELLDAAPGGVEALVTLPVARD